MNLTNLPSLLGVIALAFLLLLLVKVAVEPAPDKIAKRLLLLLLFGMLSMAGCLFFIYAGMRHYWPRLGSIEIGFTWWIGPSFYFYIKRINGGDAPFAKRLNWLHWLPALVIEALLLPLYLRPIPGTVDGLGQPLAISLRGVWYVWWGFHIQLCVYLLLSQPLLREYQRRLLNNFSAITAANLRWLQLCCYGFLAMVLAERLLPALGLTATSLSHTAGSILFLAIIALMYVALGQSRLQFASSRSELVEAGASNKYSRSGLRDDSAQYYLNKLAALMASDRWYLESELSLQTLADRLKLSPHHLSQILNDKLGRNFYDYVNTQRVEHAKQLLLQTPQKAVTDIAFASGYNSKNSFYNAFKRHCGMTPSEFRHQQEVSGQRNRLAEG